MSCLGVPFDLAGLVQIRAAFYNVFFSALNRIEGSKTWRPASPGSDISVNRRKYNVNLPNHAF